jgi:hypothetical protein
VSEIGHTTDNRPRLVEFVDGCGQLSDLTITAALLAQSGAVWDGDKATPLLPEPERSTAEHDNWQARRDAPEGRVLRVTLSGHHQAFVPVLVIRKDGWHGHKPGEYAPMQRVIYHLAGAYEFYTHGALTRRVAWTADDFKFWAGEFFRPGGLLRAFNEQAEARNRLLNLNRDRYGIASRSRLVVDDDEGGA